MTQDKTIRWFLENQAGIGKDCKPRVSIDLAEQEIKSIVAKDKAELVEASLALLKTHGYYTNKEYHSDASFNNQSIGYKEEENMINLLQEIAPKKLNCMLAEKGEG